MDEDKNKEEPYTGGQAPVNVKPILAIAIIAIFFGAWMCSVADTNRKIADTKKVKDSTSAYTDAELNAIVAKAKKEKPYVYKDKDRREYAKQFELTCLEKGLDYEVNAHGKTLRLKWILMSRPVVYKYINNEFHVTMWKGLGFKRVEFTDGYNYTTVWDVK